MDLRRWTRVVVACSILSMLTCVGQARAAISLCLETKSDRGDGAGFEKLIQSEIGRHPSHRLMGSDCESRLFAELFHLGTARYLTLRVNAEIPLRYRILSDADLERRSSEGISRVLGTDPMLLAEDPGRLSGVEREARSVLVRGTNNYRLSLFQAMARTDTGPAFAPGAAFELSRGSDHFRVFARAAFGGWPGPAMSSERVLRLLAQTDVGLLYEASSRAMTSGYAGLGAGLALLRFGGRVDAADPATLEYVDAFGATLQARAGVRFLRIFDFDLDLFLIGVLPLFSTKNPDAVLFGEKGVYTPFAQAGLGVGF